MDSGQEGQFPYAGGNCRHSLLSSHGCARRPHRLRRLRAGCEQPLRHHHVRQRRGDLPQEPPRHGRSHHPIFKRRRLLRVQARLRQSPPPGHVRRVRGRGALPRGRCEQRRLRRLPEPGSRGNAPHLRRHGVGHAPVRLLGRAGHERVGRRAQPQVVHGGIPRVRHLHVQLRPRGLRQLLLHRHGQLRLGSSSHGLEGGGERRRIDLVPGGLPQRHHLDVARRDAALHDAAAEARLPHAEVDAAGHGRRRLRDLRAELLRRRHSPRAEQRDRLRRAQVLLPEPVGGV